MLAHHSPPSADRNLLFGILALQMDFVSRDALLQAMETWVFHKTRALGDILVEQGSLRPDAHALLEPLVNKHLELHDNDPQKSLAALAFLGSVRLQLEQVRDPELQASLAHVAAGPRAEDPYATLDSSVGTPTSTGLRFKILRPHARGGLGQVSVARDEELRREVALKEIRDEYADDAGSRGRFLLEAEITGGLEHPGVVPVYGLGVYTDGRPYYAMRFIQGESLKQAIKTFQGGPRQGRTTGEQSLAFRQLLSRFMAVCHAVAYAHSRGVLHRDLKPDNVMLGKYGETLVVDWGLARPIAQVPSEASNSERALELSTRDGPMATQPGQVLGTPPFMSPEQAAGRLDLLGPASDVYSLGAILYVLLTGRPPVEGKDSGEILQRVQKGDWSRPRQVHKATPKALEAICLKAMALRPGDRYSTAQELAGDVEHWLAREPVSAWPEPWTVRARRWVGRHRTLMTAAAAAVLVALASLSAATVLLQAANTRERQAKELAEKNEQNARDEAAIATAVNEFLQNDLLGQADIGNQPFLGAAVERNRDITVSELLDRAGQAIDGKFPEQPLTEAAIRLTLGATYRALGRYAEAQPHLERSVELRSPKLGADHPGTLTSKNDLALLYQAQGKYDQAEPLFKQVLDGFTAKLGADDPRTLTCENNLATVYEDQGKYDQAEPLFKQVLDVRIDKLGANHPDTWTSKNNLAALYHTQGKYDRAEPLYMAVLKANTATLGADHPYTLTSKNSLAALYQAQGKYDSAEPLFKQVLDSFTAKLGADHPGTLTSKHNLAGLYHAQGKYDQAELLFKEVLDVRSDKLGADHPDTLTSKNDLAVLYQAQGEYDRAEQLFNQVLDARTATLGADHPDILTSKNNLAALYQAQGKYDRAKPLFKDVLDARTGKLGADHPATLQSKNNLAVLYQAQGEYDWAEPLFKQVLDSFTAKLGTDHADTLTSKNNLARLHYATGKYDQAEPLFKQVLDVRAAKLGADHPDTLTSKNNLAALYQAQGKYEWAEPLYKQVLDARTAKLGADHPDTLTSKNNLAALYRARGKYDLAEPLLREAVEAARKKLGMTHPNTQSLFRNLIDCQEKMGQPAKAEPLLHELADFWKQKAGADSPQYAGQLAALGLNLVHQQKGSEAEAVLRPSLAIRQQKQPDAWTTFNTLSMLGESLLLQKKHAEAEPLLVQGYEGMKQREAVIPKEGKVRLAEALERLVQLYEATGQQDKADAYRKQLEAARPPKIEGKL